MILRTQPSKPWNEHDFLLLEAYQQFQDERCSQCGLPVWICHNEDNDIHFKIVDDTCFAKREIESVQNGSQTVDRKVRAQWGVSARPEARTYSGKALGGQVRGDYWEELAAKREPQS